MASITRIDKIYSDGRHSAFTDMEYWKGQYFVSFRNSGGHARPNDYGDIVVIRSEDLETWEVCARLSVGEKHDDRDPHLLNLGDELGVYFFSASAQQSGGVLYSSSEDPRRVEACASFTSDGRSWSTPQRIRQEEGAVWQVERFGPISHAAFTGKAGFSIGHSADGREWEEGTPMEFPVPHTVEAGIWVGADQQMSLVVRMSCNQDMGYLARSQPPYTNWSFTELNYTVHCPVIRQVGDELWVAGKTITAQFPAEVEIPTEPAQEKIDSLTRQDERLAKTPQDWHAAIWRLVGDHLEPVLVLPSRGDCGYPGLVVEEDHVLMSYYSQHDVDEGPTPKPGEHASEIYLARIAL